MSYWSRFDWKNAARYGISFALKQIPGVGTLLSTMVSIFWPSDDNVWSEIKQDVEELVDQKLDQLVYQQVQEDLTGLNNALNDYINTVATGDIENISTQWIATDTVFDTAKPHFQSSGHEVLLLPLYAQFINLNLALLRDGVLYGSGWGWNSAYQKSISDKLSKLIAESVPYANSTYQQGYQSVVQQTKKDYNKCEPFRSVNAYVREMTLGVLDFVQMWPSFSSLTPVSVYLDREIYSDPVGTCDDSGAINLPSAPKQPISQITVWAWDRIDGVQVTYPAGGGPGGVTQTARMGDQKGGSNQAPHGGTFNVTNNPVTVAGGLAGDILNAFNFTLQDGTRTGKLGGSSGGGSGFSFHYDGHILSSIHINGVSKFYGSADCAVFGFKYPAPAPVADPASQAPKITLPGSVHIQT